MKWLFTLLLCVPAFAQDFGSVAMVGNLFHPREIAGINVHWDASTLQGANGTTVSNWVDSVSGISASNVVVSTCPQLVYTNGAKALRFDGVDDYLNAGTNTLNLLTNSWEMYCVGSMSSAANQSLFAKAIAADIIPKYGLIREAQLELLYQLNLTGVAAASTTPQGMFSSDVYFKTGYGYGFKTNGVFAVETVTSGFNGSTSFRSNFRFLVGSYGGGSDASNILPLNGVFCEFIAIKRNGSNWVSSVESRKINEYFQNKYHLQRISRL